MPEPFHNNTAHNITINTKMKPRRISEELRVYFDDDFILELLRELQKRPWKVSYIGKDELSISPDLSL